MRPCLLVGEGADSTSESKFNIFNTFKAMVKRCTFNFNHLCTMTVAIHFLSIIALAMMYGAGASDGIGLSITGREGSQ